MSKLISSQAIDGATAWVARAEQALDRAIAAHGVEGAVGFPATAYYLPVIYSFTGEKVTRLSELRDILRKAKELLPARPADAVWLPYLGNTLDAGVAALFACEIIEACAYLTGPAPVQGIWLGAANDMILRERGVEFVDGTAPGFAAITGAAPSNAIAVQIARQLQEKNLYVFMAGESGGVQFAEQLEAEGVQLGWETRLVPFGREVSALVYALGFANRAALSFGGVKPGDFAANLRYNKNRIFAFVLAFGEVTADKYAVAAGALNYGFPVIADTDIPQILPSGICTYEHVVSSVPYPVMVDKALEVRGCKIKVTQVPIPVSYGAAFEGERIRKSDVQVEFGGNRTPAFEFVTSASMDAIEDGLIRVVGPEIDEVPEGSALPLAIWVEVAGRKMLPDFEPILERQIHHLLNGAEGLWHMGQRDIVWTRVSKNAFKRGLRLRHYGEIIHAKFLNEYPAIVDKVQVTLFTEAAEVDHRIGIARQVYAERNRRLAAMTDESVETFYSCLLCQSFAPNHVCVISPERLGLCGAYNWLDGRAAYEIDQTGPNQPIPKGECLDPVKGIYQGVNEYVYRNSHKAVTEFCVYSIMDRPMTSCGCFEAICAYVPECNGIMVVNREFPGDTPVGMSFSTLAGSVGGGQQTPGFIGVGKAFLTSKKFLFAEGGVERLVWMPSELKAQLGEEMKTHFAGQGCPDLFDKIADETVATDPGELRAYLQKIGHPALTMEEMGRFAQEQTAAGSSSATARPSRVAEAPIAAPAVPSAASGPARNEPPAPQAQTGASLNAQTIAQIKAELTSEIVAGLKASLTQDIVQSIAAMFGKNGIGIRPDAVAEVTVGKSVAAASLLTIETSPRAAARASERISAIKSAPISAERAECAVWEVRLGATREQGGTRKVTHTIGGSTAMPFHDWEGQMAHRPLIAMEVFDRVGDKYPAILRQVYGDILDKPARMAAQCVEQYGADLIAVRLDGTHPERGGRTAEQAVALVKEVLAAVDVPLIITGHNHFESHNQTIKAVAQACAGENLLLNWVEQDNYRPIAGAALAYGHSLVAQSPIDVNIAKQLNILLTGMDLKKERIVIDPLTGATGYGIEYTYSITERIRQTGLGGDRMLAGPILASPGPESAKVKELRSSEAQFPSWGELSKRAVYWELSCAISLLYAGADVLVMYHPEAAVATRQCIEQLMDGRRLPS
jgi:acetyl-CoA synthase